eukprot:6180666-Pleurochrysis_carterae.AAC.2
MVVLLLLYCICFHIQSRLCNTLALPCDTAAARPLALRLAPDRAAPGAAPTQLTLPVSTGGNDELLIDSLVQWKATEKWWKSRKIS